MSSLIQITGSWVDGNDAAVQLNNSTLTRLMSFGSDWNSVRIAMRWNFVGDTGGNLSGTPKFVTGVCSGTTNPWNNGAATTTNFVGCSSMVASCLRDTVIYRWASGNDFMPITRIGTTEATGSGNVNFNQVQYNRILTKRQIWFLDITKGTPLYTVRLYSCFDGITDGGLDVTKSQFLEYAGLPTGTTPISTARYQWGTERTIAASEESGSLNAINVAWDRTLPTINIYDLAAVRLS
jgi:hypothetical protein